MLRRFSTTTLRRAASLNKSSRTITQPKDQGASQAMLYATEGVDSEEDLRKAMVGVGSVWYEGNPCNKHTLDLGRRIKKSIQDSGIIAYQFGTVGVSDGISMGTSGMRYSLQSRDLIADQFETAVNGHWLDAIVGIPSCDKNMPGVLISFGRLNRPAIMVYGGSIKPGNLCLSNGTNEPIDIVSAFQSYGAFLAEGSTETAEEKRKLTVKNALGKGCGACAGMYTANTMASAAEAMGMTLPGSSSFPADSPQKYKECEEVGEALKNLLELNITPKQIMTKQAFENAMVLTMILGGSTNAVLHLIAIAHSVGVELTIDDFQRVSDKTPFIADLKPSGRYAMNDLHQIGGIPVVLKFLLKNRLIDGSGLTVTGKSMEENLWNVPDLPSSQDILTPLNKPIKSTGHIRILKGSLAPGGAVAKITGKEGLQFTGKAHVFDDEASMVRAVENGELKKGEKSVVVLRYLGPKGGPGMPEMLKPTSLIIGAGLGKDCACVTDGRFSGGSHGFCIGHVVPEAEEGGPIGLVENGDEISIDAVKNTIELLVSEEELERRRKEWEKPGGKRDQRKQIAKDLKGTLKKYYRNVVDASHGAVTDL